MRRAALALCLLTACSGEPPAPPSAPASPPEPRAEATPPPEAREPPPPSELPLPEARTLRIEARDGLELVGDLRRSPVEGAALVVLVHQLSTTRAEWEPLLRRLGAAPALTTFAFDMRGHGESTQRGGREVRWADFETRDWELVAQDIGVVLAHLRDVERVAPSRVILVGSSIGSSAVILAAAAEPTVTAVVALSPGRAYRGVDALGPLAQLGERPLFAVASRGEPPSAETAEAMARVVPHGEALLVDGDAHGVAMFRADPAALDRVVDFIRAQAAP